jgi:isochorismate pyruvate lyase
VAKAKNTPRAKKPPTEAQAGRCRALRIGAHVWVTGATARRADGGIFGRGKPQAQAARCLTVIEKALGGVGAKMRDVVRIRIFLTDVSSADVVERSCAARFEHPPACTAVEVKALRAPGMLVELEAEAFVADGGRPDQGTGA